MAQQFKVISMAISGKSNKIYRADSIVHQGLLNDLVEKYVRDGHIIPIDEDGSTESSNEENQEEKPVLFTVQYMDEVIEVREQSDLTKKKIQWILDEKGIEYDRTKTVAVLFELLQSNM